MKKSSSIILVAIVSLIPLIFTASIPYVLPQRLFLGTEKSDHIWRWETNKIYVIKLQGGSQYTINLDTGGWDVDTFLRISDSPYMITGDEVDSGGYGGETMHFTASRTGDYYIRVGANSGSGFFDIEVQTGIILPATGENTTFYGTYILVLILPSIIIFLVGILILYLIRRRKQTPIIEKIPSASDIEKEKRVEFEENEAKFCQYCGNRINHFVKICPNCNRDLN
ncbi:MAG: hypothetical protein ACFFDH_20415 [Promethearchaeota archaeon]